MCGGSNLSTVLLLWGIYIKKCISLVRICLQTENARNASTKFRKSSESKKAEKSLEISAFLVFSCLHLNQTLMMAGMAGFGPTNAGVKVPCLTAWRHPIAVPKRKALREIIVYKCQPVTLKFNSMEGVPLSEEFTTEIKVFPRLTVIFSPPIPEITSSAVSLARLQRIGTYLPSET